MSGEHDYSDPESIGFVGHPSSPPEFVIDFDKPIWQVDMYFGRDVAMFAVNAANEKEAVANAVARAKQTGLKPITVEQITVTKLEELTDGSGTELA